MKGGCVVDKPTLTKAIELLNGAKGEIHKIEMKATPENITAALQVETYIQIVENTLVIELKGENKDADATKANV